MGTKYSTVSITGYNASPPADDGTQTASNQVKWVNHTSKLGDPLRDAIEDIDTALVAALATEAVAKVDNYTVTAAENAKTIEVTTASAGVDIILLDAATAAAGFFTTVLNAADSTDSLTVKLATSTDLLNGTTDGSISLPVDSSVTFIVNSADNGWNIKSAHSVAYTGTVGFHLTTSPAPSAGATSEVTIRNLPAGLIEMYGGSAAPSGWLLCDGAAYNSVTNTEYAALYTAIGNTYGGSDGTDFQVPDFLDRMPVGADTLTTGAGAYSLGATGGAATHTLTVDEMPSHNHGGATGSNEVPNVLVPAAVGTGASDQNAIGTAANQTDHTHTISIQGGGSAHNNLPPYLGVTFIISY